MANVNVRADEYKESDAFGDAPMDALRAFAYLDLINGVSAATRIALAEQNDASDAARAWTDLRASSGTDADDDDPHPDPEARADQDLCQCTECDGSCVTHEDDDPGPDPSRPRLPSRA
jgi:hypothetical protein